MKMVNSPPMGDGSPLIADRHRRPTSAANTNGHTYSIPDSPSFRAVENGAFDIQDEHSPTKRSSAGRLGGSIRSVNLLDDENMMHKLEADQESINEGTPLIDMDDFKSSPTSPPLVVWIFPAVSCAAAYAFYNIFIKKGSFTIHPILGGVILQFVAAILGSILLAVVVYKGDAGEIHYDRAGLFWSCCAGLAVGTAEMLSFCVSGKIL
jgi:hypothetical protein